MTTSTRRLAVAAVLAAALTTACSAAAATTPAPPTDAEVVAMFEEWNATLATGDPEQVADRYADDAILLPTVDADVQDTREERVAYFEEFLALQPRGTLTEPHVRTVGADAAVLSGLYEFAIVRDGAPETVPARMTYLFERSGDDWLISEHHSSKLP